MCQFSGQLTGKNWQKVAENGENSRKLAENWQKTGKKLPVTVQKLAHVTSPLAISTSRLFFDLAINRNFNGLRQVDKVLDKTYRKCIFACSSEFQKLEVEIQFKIELKFIQFLFGLNGTGPMTIDDRTEFFLTYEHCDAQRVDRNVHWNLHRIAMKLEQFKTQTKAKNELDIVEEWIEWFTLKIHIQRLCQVATGGRTSG